jgi:hypothetical protein
LKRDEIIGGWRKLHNEDLRKLYLPPNTIRIIKSGEMGRICTAHGEKINGYRVLMGSPEGKRIIGRPGRV